MPPRPSSPSWPGWNNRGDAGRNQAAWKEAPATHLILVGINSARFDGTQRQTGRFDSSQNPMIDTNTRTMHLIRHRIAA
jgi:hypothetical protein